MLDITQINKVRIQDIPMKSGLLEQNTPRLGYTHINCDGKEKEIGWGAAFVHLCVYGGHCVCCALLCVYVFQLVLRRLSSFCVKCVL